MTRIMLKYVNAFRDRHGQWRYYFRRHGKRTPLPGAPGSAEFMAAYGACLAEQKAPREPRKAVVTGSIADLLLRYYASPHYLALKPVTRGNYRRILERFAAEHGHRPIKGMTREHVAIIIGRMADRPGAAIVLLKRIKTLVRFAMEIGWLTTDPTHRMRSYRSTEIHTWSEDEIRQFQERWPIGSKQRLAFALHLFTGQRRSDVHRMTWGDYDGAAIKVVQQKTGAKLTIAVHPDLKAILDQTPKRGVAILLTEYGKPFTVAGYGQWMSDAIRKAELPERCVLHGLRKAAARRLAEAGCSARQIMAITGHKSLEEAERYTRAADQERLAKDAIAILSDRKNS
jgi:integrase